MESATSERFVPVSAQDRADVIDAVNRLNMAFDNWDVEAMVAAFTEDGSVHHARGDVRGWDELRIFYDAYRPLTLGVRRHAMNHVVDGLDNGCIRVTSYNLLIRVSASTEDDIQKKEMLITSDDFPALYVHAVTIDTFRKDSGFGWRIAHRTAERNVVNRKLHSGG